jgi:enoyl-CoA hydratase/carnithine racemase
MIEDHTFETVLFEVGDGVATVTLNRPERMNAFNRLMCQEFEQIWRRVRTDENIRAVVLRAAGERAFCTGVDVKEGYDFGANAFHADDPGVFLGPKQQHVYKPVVAALHGMVAGGAFYWVNEVDIAICSPEATFFDPHVTYGLTAALEPIGLARRIPLGEVLRIALMGNDERMSAETALRVSLVTEIVDREALWARAAEIAAALAAKPPAAVQGTVRAIWESIELPRGAALRMGLMYPQIGNPAPGTPVDLGARPSGPPRIR